MIRYVQRVQRIATSMDPCLLPLVASMVPIRDFKTNVVLVESEPYLDHDEDIR